MRVPMIAKWPGKIAPGTVQNGLMSGLDWFPTLVAAAGDPNIAAGAPPAAPRPAWGGRDLVGGSVPIESSVLRRITTAMTTIALALSAAVTAITPARLRECHACGQFQTIPGLRPGQTARCLRCDTPLRHARTDTLSRALALNLAALVLLGVACAMTLMTVSTAGMQRQADLFSGPEGLGRNGLWPLSVMVIFTTVMAPTLKIVAMSYVLICLRLDRPVSHVRRVYGWVEHLRPWAMVEVFLLGLIVAYTKLIDLVHIDLGVALYALVVVMLTMIAADAVLDRQVVWEEMERRRVPPIQVDHLAIIAAAPGGGGVNCHTCGLVCVPAGHAERCPRCGSALHRRKVNAVGRAWALLIGAAVLYIPANVYPVLTVTQLGSGAPSTILGGVIELVDSGMYPLAALVFVASVAVPILKVLGLAFLLIATQRGWGARLRDRGKLYAAINLIGRWSMIDIFMISILVALVQFGTVVSIEPGIGAVAFCGVVVLTMIGAESFDSRLMWDRAGLNGEQLRQA